MKAARLEALHAAAQVSEVADPVAGEGEVIVKLKAAALNHRDVWIRKGKYAGLKFPIIPGSDGAGIVESAGPGVNSNLIGSEVLINPSREWGRDERFQGKQFSILGLPEDGTFAEKVKVKAAEVFSRPAHLTWEEAAALPLAGLTAWRALMVRGGLKAGETALVSGAGGGVAVFALQFAVAAGARVFVTSSSDIKINKALELGAITGVNYKNENWAAELKALGGTPDVVVDGSGGAGVAAFAELANPGGRIVIYGGTAGALNGISPQRFFWKQLTLAGSTMGSPADFAAMVNFVNQHQIRPVVDSVFSLEETEAALARMESGGQMGKIVLKIN